MLIGHILWPIRMCCLPYKIVTSFINFHATSIVGMWAALPKDYKAESNSMFRNLSVMALLPQNVIFLFANANIPPSQQLKFNLSRMIRPLDFTSYAIPLALNTMMKAYSPFSQNDVHNFNFTEIFNRYVIQYR